MWEKSHYVREVGWQTLTGSLRCEDTVAVEEMHGRRVGGGGGGFWRVYKSGPRDLKKLFWGERWVYGELRHDQAPQFALVQLFVHTGARGSEICIYIYCTFMAVCLDFQSVTVYNVCVPLWVKRIKSSLVMLTCNCWWQGSCRCLIKKRTKKKKKVYRACSQ